MKLYIHNSTTLPIALVYIVKVYILTSYYRYLLLKNWVLFKVSLIRLCMAHGGEAK